eukprot:COSAG01_NODE_23646_length_807_cov_0.877119_2_plen_85_part_00
MAVEEGVAAAAPPELSCLINTAFLPLAPRCPGCCRRREGGGNALVHSTNHMMRTDHMMTRESVFARAVAAGCGLGGRMHAGLPV